VWKEIPFSLFAMVVFFVLGNDLLMDGNNILSRADAFILLAFFGLFLFYIYKQMQKDRTDASVTDMHLTVFKITLFIVLGFAGLVFGGRLVVTNAIDLAAAYGVSEKIIGLTIVAAGTSLPELATSVVAAYRKNNDIAVGNIVGSNIFNIFLILGVSGMIRPLSFNTSFNADIYLVAAGTLLLFLAMFLGGKKRLDRWEAAILLMVYIGYTFYLVQKEI
jgi:cation:H+ antiporter